ncbi:unnamed protein product, partial [Staurois parvus]
MIPYWPHEFSVRPYGVKVQENPKFWVVTRMGIEGKSANGYISSGDLSDNQRFHHFRAAFFNHPGVPS